MNYDLDVLLPLKSNVIDLQEFEIHTPNEDARKIYIGNALYGNYAAVFAQLIIDGQNKGKYMICTNMLFNQNAVLI